MRRRRAEVREIIPDPKFNSKLITKFINIIMIQGKRAVAEKIVYGALEVLKDKTGETSAAHEPTVLMVVDNEFGFVSAQYRFHCSIFKNTRAKREGSR